MPKGTPDGEAVRWKCTCAYDGTEYAGWQKQPNGLAVQDKIEESLAEIFGDEIRTIGSGRTDAGVHAKAQVFHFDAPWTHPVESLLKAMRVNFPEGVLPLDVEPVTSDFHALLSARGKRYRYRVHLGWAMPEAVRFVHSLKGKKVDLEKMRKVTEVFIGEHDFSAFSASLGNEDLLESKIRKVWKFDLAEEKDEVHFVVEGSGFLYKMVRSLIGAILDVGKGKMGREEVVEILQSKKRTEKIVTAPAKGLCLEEVFYDMSGLDA